MNKIIKKLFAPIAVLTLALGLSISLNNQKAVVGAEAATTTVTFVQSDVGLIFESSSTGTTINTFTKSGINFSVFAVKTKSKATSTTGYGYIMLMGGSIYNTSAPANTYVSSVTVTYTSGTGISGETIITFGSTARSSRVTAGGTAVTKSGVLTTTNNNQAKPYFNISNTTTSNIQIASVEVSFTDVDPAQPTISLNSVSTINEGETGIFGATTTNSTGATFAWSSSNNSILSINATTGEYQALTVGDVTISVVMTVNSINYTDDMLVPVNGTKTISEAKVLASALTTPSVNTGYRVTISGTSIITSVATHSIYISDGTNTIQVYGGNDWRTNQLPQSIVDGRAYVSGTLQNFNGTTPEITNPTIISYTDDVQDFATSILTGDIDGQCVTRFADYKTTVLGFTADELSKFKTSTFGNIPAARDRYLAWAANQQSDPYIASTPSPAKITNNISRNNVMAVVIIGLLSLTTISGYYFLKKKKLLG